MYVSVSLRYQLREGHSHEVSCKRKFRGLPREAFELWRAVLTYNGSALLNSVHKYVQCTLLNKFLNSVRTYVHYWIAEQHFNIGTLYIV